MLGISKEYEVGIVPQKILNLISVKSTFSQINEVKKLTEITKMNKKKGFENTK